MAFWNKSKDGKKEGDLPQPVALGRNDPCHCGSGKKYKKCCIDKDQAVERKALEEHWAKMASEAKEQAEKKSKETPTAPTKHADHPSSAQPRHGKFVPSQTSLPRKSGGG